MEDVGRGVCLYIWEGAAPRELGLCWCQQPPAASASALELGGNLRLDVDVVVSSLTSSF